jgi:hypothetical protein
MKIHFAVVAAALLGGCANAAFAQGTTTGSGIVVGGHGEILTNFHVVESCENITVKLPLKNVEAATLIARDQKNDLAVVQIKSSPAAALLPMLGIINRLKGRGTAMRSQVGRRRQRLYQVRCSAQIADRASQRHPAWARRQLGYRPRMVSQPHRCRNHMMARRNGLRRAMRPMAWPARRIARRQWSAWSSASFPGSCCR